MTKTWMLLGSLLLFSSCAGASTITGGVYTNLCFDGMSITLGPYSGSCSYGNSTFTVSADAEGSGLIWGDRISATDSSVDLNAPGNFGYAYTQYVNLVSISAPSVITLNFSVNGTTTNINGDYAAYFITAGLFQNSELVGAFPEVMGTGSGLVSMSLTQGDPAQAGPYYLEIVTYSRFCFYGCLGNDEASKAGESISDTSDFIDTFQLTSVTATNGATVIGADGTDYTDLNAAPEPGTRGMAITGLAALLTILSRRAVCGRGPDVPIQRKAGRDSNRST